MSEALRLAHELILAMRDTDEEHWDALEEAAAELRRLHAALAEPEQPVAWMQEMPVSGNEERSVRMTTVKMVADGWENPIPLFTQPAQALAEPEQEPVAQALEALNKMQSIGLMMADGRHPRDVLRSFIHGAAPTPRKPLTDEQLEKVFPAIATYHEANKTLYRSIARAIEHAHGITNQN